MAPHILIIDDDRDICTIKKAQLEHGGGFKVTVADKPDKGLKLARSQKPDLILLDIMMPEKDGFEVLNELKNDIQTAAIPVIMHTGIDDDQSKLRAAELYNEGYVLKASDRATLISAIQQVLSRHVR
jgi:CheY-like chemotaxis protein